MPPPPPARPDQDVIGLLVLDTQSAKDALGRVHGSFVAHLAQGAVGLAETVMLLSKAEYVPVRTGALRSSGAVLPAEVRRDGSVLVTMGYGDASVRYAGVVHAIHATKAHYLSIPFHEVMGRAGDRLAAHMRTWSLER